MNRIFMPNTQTVPALESDLRHSSLRVYWTLLILSVAVVRIITIVGILRNIK